MADLFNAMVYCGKCPVVLNMVYPCVNQWRPITIGPILMLAFSGILTQRLTETFKVHTGQKGFVKSPGCSENLALLNGILQTCKRNRTPLNVVFIDFLSRLSSQLRRNFCPHFTWPSTQHSVNILCFDRSATSGRTYISVLSYIRVMGLTSPSELAVLLARASAGSTTYRPYRLCV